MAFQTISGILFVIFFAGFGSGCIYEEIAENITILYYPTNNASNRIEMPLKDAVEKIPSLPEFDNTLESLLYFPGWGEDALKNDSFINMILPALVQLNYTNIFIVNYVGAFTPISDDLSIDTATAIRIHDVGHVLGLNLLNYTDSKVQPRYMLRLLGWSIGAQVMAQAAHTYSVYGEHKHRLHRLTALDPIGWNTSYPLHHELDAYTGHYVIVIHTDPINYGYDRNLGTIDFYVDRYNQSTSACHQSTDDRCLHNLALKYYAESILNDGDYVGGYFSSYCNIYWDCENFQNIQAVMGFYTPTYAFPGTYYLNSVDNTLALTSYDS